jgi:hypothetical protein
LTLGPTHENLRRAIRWLSDHSPATAKTIDEASIRFDLSPQDEQFLLAHFVEHRDETPPQK